MKKRIPTCAEFMAASYICLAIKQQFVDQAQGYEALAKEATGQEKKRLQKLAKQANDRCLFYLRQGLRASEGATCPKGQKPSKETMMAYEKAVTRYVRRLSITERNPPQP